MNPAPSTLRSPRLDVSIYAASLLEAPTAHQLEEMNEAILTSTQFWLEKADIRLVWKAGAVDVLNIPSLWTTGFDRRPLDELVQPGTAVLPIYFTGHLDTSSGGGWGTNEYSSDSTGFLGLTLFAQPWFGLPGYGCVIPFTRMRRKWNVVAHEIGHAFGLPHLGPQVPDNETEGDGVRSYTEVCMDPFEDDLLHYVQKAGDANLMSEAGGQDENATLENLWLSKSQVLRARLTVTTRDCPFATRFEGGAYSPPNVKEYGPLMSDLPSQLISRL